MLCDGDNGHGVIGDPNQFMSNGELLFLLLMIILCNAIIDLDGTGLIVKKILLFRVSTGTCLLLSRNFFW